MKKKEFAFFWGCQIPARFTFMEKSTRLVLDRLGVLYKDMDGFTCCPEKTLAENLDSDLWKVMAARNIAIAEKAGLDLLTACNGCYSTFKTVSSDIKTYPKTLRMVNEKLKPLDLEIGVNKYNIKHIVELFHDDVGLTAIKKALTKSMDGMKIAVHGGCHLIKPSKAIHFDDTSKPKKYDDLIEVLGAKSAEYHTKSLCCGGSLDRVDQKEMAMDMARAKLREIKGLKVDAISTTCPECFRVFDTNQIIFNKGGDDYHIPVFTYPELLGLGMGFEPEELGLENHKTDCGPFLEKLKSINERKLNVGA
jgi:CoB--CoM heterodisulfide reductase subunit B